MANGAGNGTGGKKNGLRNGSLSREEQGIFTARYFYAVPLEQIAETYGNSLRQIQYRLQKMRTSLRKCLEQEGIAV